MANKKKSTVLLLSGLVVLLLGATALYDNLAKDVKIAPPPVTEPIEAVDFIMSDVDGNIVSLSDYYGKPIVLNFWASWCPPCKLEMPYFQSMYDTYGEDINFIMLNATDGSRETKKIADEFIAETGYTFPILYDFFEEDGEDINQLGSYIYGISSLPSTIFIDSEGFIASAHLGTMDEETLSDYISLITE